QPELLQCHAGSSDVWCGAPFNLRTLLTKVNESVDSITVIGRMTQTMIKSYNPFWPRHGIMVELAP
ncbi:MAG TPA: hypothetical protein VF221_10430, partial [Chloroflexota bacterium]